MNASPSTVDETHRDELAAHALEVAVQDLDEHLRLDAVCDRGEADKIKIEEAIIASKNVAQLAREGKTAECEHGRREGTRPVLDRERLGRSAVEDGAPQPRRRGRVPFSLRAFARRLSPGSTQRMRRPPICAGSLRHLFC